MDNKPNFFLVHVGMQEFVTQIIDEDISLILATENLDGKDIQYVKSITTPFLTLKNIFQEVPVQGGKPQLQRMKGVLLTVNVAHVTNIAMISTELQNKLSAAVSGLIV